MGKRRNNSELMRSRRAMRAYAESHGIKCGPKKVAIDNLIEDFFKIERKESESSQKFHVRAYKCLVKKGLMAVIKIKAPTSCKVKLKLTTPKQKYSGFYGSREWRAVRYQAIVKYDGCCLACGRSYKKHGIIIHVDHVKPRSLHPELELDIDNLQILCEDCNLGKSNKDDTDWR